jgi:hypothetical protein
MPQQQWQEEQLRHGSRGARSAATVEETEARWGSSSSMLLMAWQWCSKRVAAFICSVFGCWRQTIAAELPQLQRQ